MDEALRYPIGKFVYAGLASAAECAERARALRDFPWELREAVAGLSDAQLDTPYREVGGRRGKSCIILVTEACISFAAR